MLQHDNLTEKEIRAFIRSGKIALGGNARLKIFGLLGCSSGKRMLSQNRMFFRSMQEAVQYGYRPCGNCMKDAYRQWKNKQQPS